MHPTHPLARRSRVAGAWRRLPRLPAGTAVLLFGLCTAWRSNDRIPAAEHRWQGPGLALWTALAKSPAAAAAAAAAAALTCCCCAGTRQAF